MIGSRLLAGETKETGKEEGKGEKKIFLWIQEKKRRRICENSIFPLFGLQKEKKGKNAYFYLFILINNEKIHIF